MVPGPAGNCLVAWASTTVDSERAAQTLAQAGVKARLAACAQVEKIHSHYWWDGQLQQGDEWRITWKTTPQRLQALQRELPPCTPMRCRSGYGEKARPARRMRLGWAPKSARHCRLEGQSHLTRDIRQE